MDLTTLRDRLSFVLENNDGQTSQAFSTARLNDALNWAYRQEVNYLQLEGGRDWCKTTTNISWAASQVTYQLPPSLAKKNIMYIQDITNSDPGEFLRFGAENDTGRLHWKDSVTLQWGTNGPPSAVTLRIAYYQVAQDMVEDDDSPDMLPEQYHELLVWSAAILLLDIADQQSPMSWRANRDDMRMNITKYMSYARPADDVARPRMVDPDDGILY